MGGGEENQSRIVIRGGEVVNADRTERLDVFIEDGKISELGLDLKVPEGTLELQAKDMYVIPGGIDPHTHCEFEFMGTRTADDFYTGTRAAIAGGTTTIIDFAIARPGQSIMEAYDKYRRMADPKVCCDYGLHIGVTWWSPTVSKEMEVLSGRHGVNSYKLFLAYKGMFMVDDGELYDAFSRCRELGAVAMVHAENGHVIEKNVNRLKEAGVVGPEGHEMSRPEDVEAEAVNRAAMIADQTSCPLYVVHVMSEPAAKVIQERRSAGQESLFGEALAAGLGAVCPSGACSFEHAAAYVMSPPLRKTESTPLALMRALASGALQTTASDNCTFNREQKALGKGDFTKIPNGVNGLEDRMSIVWDKGVASGLMSPQRFVQVTSTNAAKVFNLYPRKGCIEVGSDADVVIWNPKRSRKISAETHQHACDTNIFEGLVVRGVAEAVIARGRVCYSGGRPAVAAGHGRYVHCPAFPPHVYGARAGRGVQRLGAGTAYSANALNFHDRQLLANALEKAAPTALRGCLKLFKEFDQRGNGRVGPSDFQKVLHAIDALPRLSSREVEVLIKAFTSGHEQIAYEQFVSACSEQCGAGLCEPEETQ